ncbi:MAG: hypothetical protein JNK65_01635, partial [Deltaproteobacteria bacterium]|nr:hypothetical protein [Deltaproteobacteria bacterium]
MPPIYFGASDSLLSRLSASSFEQSSLTSTQSFVDQSVSTFVQQTTQWQPVLAMMTGSLFYRFGRLATLGLGGSHSIPISLASHGAGLVFEASSFEFAHRGLAHLSESSPSHGWNLSGRGGILEGIRNNLVNFGTLRLSASFTASQNVFLRNLVGDVAMVSGEEISHQLGFQSRPEGDLFQRFLHAQVIQTQLHLGNTLAFSFAPSLHAFERGLELSQPSPFENFSRPQARPLLEFPALQMAMLGPKSGGALEVEKSYMASMNSEGGNGSSSSSQAPLRTESRREANSSSSLFDAAKTVLSDMRGSELSPREWEIHYTGVYPGEGKVPSFLDKFDAWFRLSSNHIPEGHRIAFVLEPLGKKMVFSSERVNDETRVNRSIVDLNMSASPSILEGTTAATGSQPPSPSPTPPPPPTQR